MATARPGVKNTDQSGYSVVLLAEEKHFNPIIMAFIALLHLDNNFPRISFKRILFLRFGTLSFITRYINVVILPTLVWHHDVFLLDLAHQGTPLLAVSEVLLVLVDEPCVVLAADQDDRGVGAEAADLVMPHGPAVLQGDQAPRVVAHQHHVSPAIRKPPVLSSSGYLNISTILTTL